MNPEALIERLHQSLVATYGEDGEYPEYPRAVWLGLEEATPYWDWVMCILLTKLRQSVLAQKSINA